MARKADIETQMIGHEPEWSTFEGLNGIEISTKMLRAYSWYNYTVNEADRVKYLYEYLRQYPKILKAIKTLPAHKIPSTVCWIARLLSRGCPIPASDGAWFNARVYELFDSVKPVRRVVKKTNAPKISVRQRMMEKVSEDIAAIENEIDMFVENDYTSEFSTYEWLKENDIKGKPAAEIAKYFRPLAKELASHDEQVDEAYGHLSKKQRKDFLAFVVSIIRDVETWSDNKKVDRKPRKARSVSSVSKTSKVKVMKQSDEFRLVSVDPVGIIGADVVWTFNTKNRILSRYVAEGPSGLTVSRSSIRGFSISESYGKKVRDPAKLLTKIVKGGKVATRKTIEQIKAKKSDVTGRLSGTIILLKTEK